MRGATIVAVITFCVCVSLSAGGGALAGKQERADAGAITKCDVEAYVNHPDPRGTNVRSGPGSSYKVIGILPDQQAEGITVHITGTKGERIRITALTSRARTGISSGARAGCIPRRSALTG